MNNLTAEIGRKWFILLKGSLCSSLFPTATVFVLNESSLTTRENLVFATIYDRSPVAKR